jgi:tyrosine-protein phosphatase SIW14
MTDNSIKQQQTTEENNNNTTVTTVTTTNVPKSLTDPNWSLLDSYNVQDDAELFEEALIPPENFNMVCEHVYRSSFPKKKHYKFLEKLKLKSVL